MPCPYKKQDPMQMIGHDYEGIQGDVRQVVWDLLPACCGDFACFT